jgi:hypothetical protein
VMSKRRGKYDSSMGFGSVFTRLTSLGAVRSNPNNRMREYLFVCECGSIKWIPGPFVARWDVVSCGCYARDAAAHRCKNRATHKLSYSPLYRVWADMMSRCYKPSNKSYVDYGQRGISVYPEWHDVECFVKDVEPLWEPGLQMDRVDNSRGYEPGNIRFISCRQNQRNRRDNRLITIDGVTKCASEWAEEFGIKQTLFLQRIDRDGMDPKQALTYKRYKEDENGLMRKQRKIHGEAGGSILKNG